MHFLHLMYSKRFVEMYPRVSRAILTYNSDQYNRHFYENSFLTPSAQGYDAQTDDCFFSYAVFVSNGSMGAVIKSGSVCWCLCPKGRISGQSVVIVTVSVVLNQNRNKSWQHCAIYNVDQTQLLVLFSITPHRHSLTNTATVLNT